MENSIGKIIEEKENKGYRDYKKQLGLQTAISEKNTMLSKLKKEKLHLLTRLSNYNTLQYNVTITGHSKRNKLPQM